MSTPGATPWTSTRSLHRAARAIPSNHPAALTLPVSQVALYDGALFQAKSGLVYKLSNVLPKKFTLIEVNLDGTAKEKAPAFSNMSPDDVVQILNAKQAITYAVKQ